MEKKTIEHAWKKRIRDALSERWNVRKGIIRIPFCFIHFSFLLTIHSSFSVRFPTFSSRFFFYFYFNAFLFFSCSCYSYYRNRFRFSCCRLVAFCSCVDSSFHLIRSKCDGAFRGQFGMMATKQVEKKENENKRHSNEVPNTFLYDSTQSLKK